MSCYTNKTFYRRHVMSC